MTGAGAAAAALSVATAPPAWAHGGAGGSLPLETWQLAWGAGAIVVILFGVLGVVWVTPRLAEAAVGTAVPRPVDVAARAVGIGGRVVALGVLALTLAAAFLGPAQVSGNPTPLLVYLVFWIGLQILSPLVGDVWGAISPLDTLARALVGGGLGRHDRPVPDGLVRITAPAGIVALGWFMLAYHSPATPRVLGWAVLVYVVAHLGLVARYGRGWLARGESFTVYFALLASLAPLARTHDDDGGPGPLRLRPPVAGLGAVTGSPVLLAVVLSALGVVTFDGLSRLPWWLKTTDTHRGWDFTLLGTLGLAWSIALVAAAYLTAAWLSGRLAGRGADEVGRAFVPALAPLAVVLTVAHYAWPIILDSQTLAIQLTDPFLRGWDLLGAADWYVNYSAATTGQVAWAQFALVVAGHAAAVLVLHDRALRRERHDLALKVQYPLLALVVASAVGGMALVLTV